MQQYTVQGPDIDKERTPTTDCSKEKKPKLDVRLGGKRVVHMILGSEGTRYIATHRSLRLREQPRVAAGNRHGECLCRSYS